jgi:hypothetical protein
MKKYLFMQGDLRNNFSSGNFHTIRFRVYTMIETAKITQCVGPISPTVLCDVEPKQYKFLYCTRISCQPTAGVLCWANWPNTPPRPPWSVRLISPTPPHPFPWKGGDTAPHPFPWHRGGEFHHHFLANCSTCIRITLPKTAMRSRVNGTVAWH